MVLKWNRGYKQLQVGQSILGLLKNVSKWGQVLTPFDAWNGYNFYLESRNFQSFEL